MRGGWIQVELLNSQGESAVYWIPAASEVRTGLKLRLRETGSEEWTVKQAQIASTLLIPKRLRDCGSWYRQER